MGFHADCFGAAINDVEDEFILVWGACARHACGDGASWFGVGMDKDREADWFVARGECAE